jgi:hypothetical protein
MIICEQAKVCKVESWANCAAHECILAQRPCCLPNPGADCANRRFRVTADWTQPVTQNSMLRWTQLQQLQRPAFIKMPDLVRCNLMPAAEATLREEEIDRRQRSTRTATILRADLNWGPEYLPIEAALGVRPQTQHCDQLSGSRVHLGKSVSNRGKLPGFGYPPDFGR